MVELRTSFIPKKQIVFEEEKRQSTPVSFLTTISAILFFFLLAVAGGLYFYKATLEREIGTMSESLDRAREAVDAALVASLKRLDDRMQVANVLLQNHVTVSPIFNLLEETTLQSVQFDRFTYLLSDNGETKITLTGKARGYSSLALQSDAFGENQYIVEPVFSNLGLDSEGRVLFSFSSPIKKSFLLWRNNVSETTALPSL